MLKGEGFPQYKRPFDKGDLIIQFNIKEMTPEVYKAYCENTDVLQKIKNLLGSGDDDEIEHQDYEEVQAVDYDETIHKGRTPDEVSFRKFFFNFYFL